MALYHSTGDGVVDFRTVDQGTIMGTDVCVRRSSTVWYSRSLLGTVC